MNKPKVETNVTWTKDGYTFRRALCYGCKKQTKQVLLPVGWNGSEGSEWVCTVCKREVM